MTDEQIIKALKCFALNKDSECYDCRGCAFESQGLCYENASEGIAKASLDLISHYKAENTRLQAKIHRLEKYDEERDIRLHTRLIATARTEAFKEFAERLKEEPIKCGLPLLGLQTKEEIETYFDGIMLQVKDAIDNTVKELTEGSNT